MKKGGLGVLSIIVVIAILYIAGYIMDRSDTREYEKEIISYVEEGEYYTAIERYYYYSGVTLTGFSKNTDKLVNDVIGYVLICEELEKIDTNYEQIDLMFDEMTGRYKKYKTLKEDVNELKKLVKQEKKENGF